MTSAAAPLPPSTGSTPDREVGGARDGLSLVAEPRRSRLHERAVEARARLAPERPLIPAPRSAGGVTPPAALDGGADGPSAEVAAATDALVEALAVLDGEPEEPAHRVLVRIDELTATGIPDRGWAATEGFDPEALAAAASKAGELHAAATAPLAQLDEAGLASPAVVVDALATALQIDRMVADLEVLGRQL